MLFVSFAFKKEARITGPFRVIVGWSVILCVTKLDTLVRPNNLYFHNNSICEAYIGPYSDSKVRVNFPEIVKSLQDSALFALTSSDIYSEYIQIGDSDCCLPVKYIVPSLPDCISVFNFTVCFDVFHSKNTTILDLNSDFLKHSENSFKNKISVCVKNQRIIGLKHSKKGFDKALLAL